MLGVITGFSVIASIVTVGWLVGRMGTLGEKADHVLSRLAFFVLTPSLLLTVMVSADTATLFSSLVPVSMIAAITSFLAATIVVRFVWKRTVAETTIVALASGYVNANNIGLPVALYVLGNAALAAPLIMVNLGIFAPIALAILEASTRGHTSWKSTLLRPAGNPIIIASILGITINLMDFPLPSELFEPFRIMGAAAVPVMLLLFGGSLHGAKILAADGARKDVGLALALKIVLMPAVAWVFGQFVFDLTPEKLLAVVVFAALPNAQNVFSWAHRFNRHIPFARDAILMSTLATVPAIFLIVWLLGA